VREIYEFEHAGKYTHNPPDRYCTSFCGICNEVILLNEEPTGEEDYHFVQNAYVCQCCIERSCTPLIEKRNKMSGKTPFERNKENFEEIEKIITGRKRKRREEKNWHQIRDKKRSKFVRI